MSVNRQRSILFYLVLASMPVGASLFRVWVHQDAVQMGYALAGEEHRREGLRTNLHELEVEVASERSPARLVRIAANLGLRPPATGQLVSGTQSSHLARADVEGEHATP